MSKTIQSLDEYTLKFLDRIIFDIQTYEEYHIKLEDLNPFYRLYNNATLHYFILSLRSLIDKKGDEKSSIPIFLGLLPQGILKNNPTGLNKDFIKDRLESKMQKIREKPYINKYFAHLNTNFLADIIAGHERLPDIDEVVNDLKEIIRDFILLIHGYDWIPQKRHKTNIGII